MLCMHGEAILSSCQLPYSSQAVQCGVSLSSRRGITGTGANCLSVFRDGAPPDTHCDRGRWRTTRARWLSTQRLAARAACTSTTPASCARPARQCPSGRCRCARRRCNRRAPDLQRAWFPFAWAMRVLLPMLQVSVLQQGSRALRLSVKAYMHALWLCGRRLQHTHRCHW